MAVLTSERIHEYLNSLAKPPGSLGRLEDVAARLCMIQQTLEPLTTPRRVVLFAADHGVVSAGVTAWPAEVTGLMINTIARGQAASSVLARTTSTDLRLIDVGSLHSGLPESSIFRRQIVRAGTRNLAVEPALTVEEFRQAVTIGEQQAMQARQEGMVVVAAGEMGIGNTTAASCLTALITGNSSDDVVGMGAGADSQTLARKRQVVRDAVRRSQQLFTHSVETAVASMTGLEIAAIAGFFHQANQCGLTVVLDGFVATAGALIAEALWPGTRECFVAAHRSAEPGHSAALAKLGLEPILDGWQMRLGEGTGALLAMPILDAAAAVMKEMATLKQIGT